MSLHKLKTKQGVAEEHRAFKNPNDECYQLTVFHHKFMGMESLFDMMICQTCIEERPN